jgi:hypothetical protein
MNPTDSDLSKTQGANLGYVAGDSIGRLEEGAVDTVMHGSDTDTNASTPPLREKLRAMVCQNLFP